MTTRLLPPTNVQQQTIIANGRSYSSTPGHAVDVLDDDAAVLSANGWLRVAFSGPTTARPTSSLGNGSAPARGAVFYDTSISKIAIWDGATWRSRSTGLLSKPNSPRSLWARHFLLKELS
jgi:hypothetical protein